MGVMQSLSKLGPVSRNRFLAAMLFVTGLLLLCPAAAHAMHIAEGILPAQWAVLWYVVAFVFVALGIRTIQKRTKEDKSLMPLLGLTGALIFLVSVFPVPVPFTGTCSHPCGTPLGAILVGPLISTVLGAIALLLQALFLAHGGLSTLGANVVSMAVVGSFVGFGVFILLRRFDVSLPIAAFAGGLLGDWGTYAITSLELASSLQAEGSFFSLLWTIVVAFAPTQAFLGILEGLFTAGVVVAIYQRRPELLSFGRSVVVEDRSVGGV